MSADPVITRHGKPAPLGGGMITPVTAVAAVLAVIAIYVLAQRFIHGLGAVTNISNGYPWGIWIAYDVVIGTALACGGYAMALLVYIANKGHYHPLVRPALLASLFGYTLGGLSVIFDLGRWWNFWHILSPAYSNYHSVMVEVALCISAYIVVLWIEFSPAFLERLGMKDLRAKLDKVLFLFIALGVLLPTMHQSSLGSLIAVFGYQVHPLWQTPLLPLLFLVSSVTMGFSVVIFEACLSSSGFKRPLETPLLARLAGVMAGALVVFLVLRVLDLAVRGVLGAAFTFDLRSCLFLLETVLFIVPVVLLAAKANRSRPSRLFLAAASMLAAGSLYRIDAYLVAYRADSSWSYFPSVPELMVTFGIIAIEVLGYVVLVKYLPVLPSAEPARTAAAQNR